MSTLEIAAAALGAVTGWLFGGFIGRLHVLARRQRPFGRVERNHSYDSPKAA